MDVVCSVIFWLQRYRNESFIEAAGEHVAKPVEYLCNCQFSADYILIYEPFCPTDNPDWIVLWGRLFGTNSSSSIDILQYLQKWVKKEDSTVTVEGVTLSTMDHCPVFLERNQLPSCEQYLAPGTEITTTSTSNSVAIIVSVIVVIMLILVLIVVVCIIAVVLWKKAYSKRNR